MTDYKLRNTEDLLRVHGIDFAEVDGYSSLDDLNKTIYEKFIVNFFNAWNLDNRLNIIPKGIYFVEEIEYLVKEKPENDYYNIAGYTIYTIDFTGNKKLLHKWEKEEYKNLEKTVENLKYYLRFEYQNGTDTEGNPCNEWMHVAKSGSEWY